VWLTPRSGRPTSPLPHGGSPDAGAIDDAPAAGPQQAGHRSQREAANVIAMCDVQRRGW
jgi:hypothetical protein